MAPPTYVTQAQLRAYARGAAAGFLVLLAGVGYSIQSSNVDSSKRRRAIVNSARVVSVAGCNRDFATITSLRAVLLRGQSLQRRNRRNRLLTLDEYHNAVRYDARQIKDLKLPDCRKAASVVTNNPAADRIIAVPLHARDK